MEKTKQVIKQESKAESFPLIEKKKVC